MRKLLPDTVKDNFNLAIAWDRLAQAQALARKSNADLLPRVDMEAGFRRNRQEIQDSTVYSSLYSLGITAG